jgi:methyl-accepting chemotaxis protein
MSDPWRYFREKLEVKVLALILIILIGSFAVIYRVVSDRERKNLLAKELEKSTFIANTVHETLDKDMMAFRADLVRHLIEDVGRMPGIIRLQIVRGDGPYLGDGRGRDQAFQDFKTLNDVHKRLNTLYRPEWETEHATGGKAAEGSDNPKFKEYFSRIVQELNNKDVMNNERGIREEGSMDYSYIETVNGIEAMTYLRPLPNFPKCALCHGTGYNVRGILMITTSMEDVNLQVQKSKNLLLGFSIVTLTIVVLLMRMMLKRVVLNPLNEVVVRMRDIAEGGGDLTRRIAVAYKDEIGAVAYWMNVFIEKLHHIISQVSRTSTEVNKASRQMLAGKEEITEGATVQLNAAKDTTGATKEMNAFTREIADRTESLSELTQESATAVLEMSAAIDHIAQSTATLSTLVEDSTASILEMSSSIKQIDENVESLSENAKDSAGSMDRMDESIGQVRSSVHDTVELSRAVLDDAERGMTAVDQIARWIHQTQEYSKQIEHVIDNLKNRTENIGKILEVIDEVAEQTNLLAINAAIIAAEAGEHGKSFSVVAQEIKELSDRTATSTQEIHDIIVELQDQSKTAATVIQEGTNSVDEGVKLSREATSALNQIMESSRKSTERIQGIAETTDGQAGAVKNVLHAMQRINDMVHQIGRATHEQSLGSGNIITATDKIRDIAVKLKSATQQQAIGNKHISEIIERVNRMVKEIAEATGKQKVESQHISEAMERINAVIQQNMETFRKVGRAIDDQMTQVNSLSSEINKFKL